MHNSVATAASARVPFFRKMSLRIVLELNLANARRESVALETELNFSLLYANIMYYSYFPFFNPSF